MKKLILSIAIMLLCSTAMAQNAKMPNNVSLKTLDGKTVESSVIQNDGKPIIISFWSTTCKPCIKELKAISEVYDEWQEETGVKLVAISVDDSRSASRVVNFVNGNGWDYEVYLDQNQDFKRAMNVVMEPHVFLLNGEGEIVWQHTAYVDGSEEELFELVKKVAKGEDI